MKYEVRHTVDESGARYIGDGPMDMTTNDLSTAIEYAEDLVHRGKCGYVRRTKDGKTLMPDGSWSE